MKDKQEIQPTPARLRAVIDIGATSARMTIAEIKHGQASRTLEYLEQSVSLGREGFGNKRISNPTIDACVRACSDFKTVLDEYQISDPTHIRAVATSAVAESNNSDHFLDRILMATGLNVDILADVEINRLFYFSILPLLEQEPALCKGHVLALDAGGGNTTALWLDDGIIRSARTYRFGAYRTREILENAAPTTAQSIHLMEDEVQSLIRPIVNEFECKTDIKLLILGSEARLAAAQINGDSLGPVTSVCLQELEELADSIVQQTPPEISRAYDIPIAAAESFGPALLAIKHIARTFQCKTLHVGAGSMRDGLLREMANDGSWDVRFTSQILESATEIGEHYQFDREHAQNVTQHSKAIFHELKARHSFTAQDEVILTVAALLHDIGSFINSRSHHKHTYYLINNSDIFGLSLDDLHIASLVARYHRRAHPKATHRPYAALSRLERLRVSKLAAILRVADALDTGHNQRIQQASLTLKKNHLKIGVPDRQRCAVEELALPEKSALFEQVYGIQVSLKQI